MKPNFGFFIIALCIGFFPEYSAFAKKCNSGSFLFSGQCYTCDSGCYCPYPGDVSREKLDPKNDIKNEVLEKWCDRRGSCDHTDKSHDQKKYGYQECGKNNEAKVFRCPEQFPYSAGGSTSIEQCYTLAGSTKLYYKKITCISGEYLPINSDTCVLCRTGTSDYCPGLKDVYPSITSDQGIKTCASGQHANSSHTTCENQTNQPTETTKEYTDELISVPAGNYLPANSSDYQPCTNVSRKQFCPGGDFYKSSTRQGIYDCPYTTSEDHKKCTLSLTKEQMQYGISGGKSGNTGTQCWAETNPDNYKSCVMGKN